MKRFVFWFLVALLAFAWMGATRQRPQQALVRSWVSTDEQAGPPGSRVVGPDGRPIGHANPFVRRGGKILESNDRGLTVLYEDGSGGKRIEFYPDPAREAVVLPDDVFRSADPVRVPAEGLPVPVVPGTRVTEARVEVPRPEPPTRPRFQTRPQAPRVRPFESRSRIERDTMLVVGRLSATAERARNDAMTLFRNKLADILSPDVPRWWNIPEPLFRKMIRRVEVKPVARDYGTVYEATLHADVSPGMRSEVVAAYHHVEVMKRLALLGSLFAFVLICLAAVSGYIRADEATKGYYTNSLRLAAAAGVGAAGVVIYQVLT